MTRIYRDRSGFVAPPCPNCGARAVVNWVDVSQVWQGDEWIVSSLECSARCWELRGCDSGRVV